MEVEVAIRLLYMLAEALPVSHGAHFSGDTKANALQDMMRTVSMMQRQCDLLHFFSFDKPVFNQNVIVLSLPPLLVSWLRRALAPISIHR